MVSYIWNVSWAAIQYRFPPDNLAFSKTKNQPNGLWALSLNATGIKHYNNHITLYNFLKLSFLKRNFHLLLGKDPVQY